MTAPSLPGLYRGDGELGEEIMCLRAYPGSDGVAFGASAPLPFRLKVEVSVAKLEVMRDNQLQ